MYVGSKTDKDTPRYSNDLIYRVTNGNRKKHVSRHRTKVDVYTEQKKYFTTGHNMELKKRENKPRQEVSIYKTRLALSKKTK